MDMQQFKQQNQEDTALQQLYSLIRIIRGETHKYASEEEKRKMEDWLIEELQNKIQDLKTTAAEYDRWVVVEDKEDSGIFCLGIFKDYLTAVGRVMDEIYSFHESYKDEGDEFSYTDLWPTEGDGGYGITVTFKAAGWKAPHTHTFYVLNGREHKEGGIW